GRTGTGAVENGHQPFAGRQFSGQGERAGSLLPDPPSQGTAGTVFSRAGLEYGRGRSSRMRVCACSGFPLAAQLAPGADDLVFGAAPDLRGKTARPVPQ